ncbi:MAG: hypothetical protein ABI855_10200, partial [Bacteroidota bacterium]
MHNKRILFASVLLMFTGLFTNSNATTKNSVSSGNWDNPAVWTPAGIPGINDNVIILSNHIVTVNNNAEVNSIIIDENGELNFLTGKILTMHSNLTVEGKLTMNGGNIHFGSAAFILGGNSTFIWDPSDNTAAGATLFTNGTEHFDPTSTLVIKKWYNYSSVPLGAVVTGNFGNVTLNSLFNSFLYEWNQNNQFETHKIIGTLTIDQGWIVLDKSGSISNTTIGNINLTTPNAFLDFHNGTHNSSFTVNTTTITNIGGNLNGIYNGNGKIILNVSGTFANLGNVTMIYNTGIFGVGNGDATLNVEGDFNQQAGDFRAIFNLTTTTAGASNLNFNNINLTGGIMMGYYACHTSSATCTFKVNGNFNINFVKPTDKFRVIGLTSLSGTYNNMKLNLIVNGNLVITGNAAAEFTSSGGVGSEIVSIGGAVNISGCTNNFNMGSHQLTLNTIGNFNISGGATSLSKTPGDATINISGNFIQSSGIISIKGHTGTANVTVGGNFSVTNGIAFLHSNSNSASSNSISLIINGNFTQTGGIINYDDNPSDNSINNIYIKGGQYSLNGNGTITRAGAGATAVSGNLFFAKEGTIAFQRNVSSHCIQQVKQIINSGCTLEIVSGNLQVSSYSQHSSDQLKVSSGGVLKMNSSKIISNNLLSYSGITVDNNGRLSLQHANGLYNGTDNACISSTGNMNYFLAPNSIVEYNGKNNQGLSGIGTGVATTSNHKYGKLEINFQGAPDNENIFLSTSNVFVRTALILTKGELKLNNNTLTIESGTPTAITRGTGYIKSETIFAYNQSFLKWMNVSSGLYIFPFGVSSNEYIPFTFTPVSGSGTVAIATRSTGTDNLPYPNGGTIPAITDVTRNGVNISISNVIDRWYDIIASGFTANVTISYRGVENTTADSVFQKMFSIQSWDGTNWSRSMGGTTGVKTGIGTVSASNVSSFNHWMISTTTNEISSTDEFNFGAILKNNIVESTWSVSSSVNSGYFFVERSSDQITFSEIGKINAGESQNYIFNDDSPLIGISYYHIKQVNKEGRIFYSKNATINFKDESTKDFSIISVYPNPFSQATTVLLSIPQSENVSLKIYDAIGRLVSTLAAFATNAPMLIA